MEQAFVNKLLNSFVLNASNCLNFGSERANNPNLNFKEKENVRNKF
jgi:hypothetical protein